MAGKLFKNDLRLSKAYSEGFDSPNGATNPHWAGMPEAEAWAAGYDQCSGGSTCASETCYKGDAAHKQLVV